MTRQWDPDNQMPRGTEFEVYHMTDIRQQKQIFHSHPYYELYFFLEGKTRLIVENLDICPKRGDAFLFPPYTMHRNIHLDGSVKYERFYCYIDPSFLQKMSMPGYSLPDAFRAVSTDQGYYFRLEEKTLLRLLDLADEIIREAEKSTPEAMLFARFKMGEFVILSLQAFRNSRKKEAVSLSESGHSDAGSSPVHLQRMDAFITYLKEHFTEELSLQALAERFFVSKYTLLREFSDYSGLSIRQYILAQRVRFAQELLLQGRTAQEAALQSGFSDYTVFYRAFKKRTGTSPRAFAKSTGDG